MTHTTFHQRTLLAYLQDRYGDTTTIACDTDLIEAGLLDSLMVMDLVCFVQSSFDVVFEAREISPRNFCRVDQLAGLIEAKLSVLREAA